VIGNRISNFEVLEKLGEGGMGVVYKARDTRLSRHVAIKVLSGSGGDAQNRTRRFLQEARAASALNHPNIVTVHDIGAEGDQDYIVMEFIEGKSLDAMIPRGGMKLRDALKIAAQVAGAMGRAHRAGILHRDLKPSNIMVEPDGLVKVVDFGLAKRVETPVAEGDLTRTSQPVSQEGAIIGTIAYMSPEQTEGSPLDARSEVFSFGTVLYEMLSGTRPFEGATRASVMAAIQEREPRPVNGLSGELERLMMRCLRKSPDRRWQSMDDLRIALEDLTEESPSGMLAAPARPAPLRRRTWVIAMGVLALAALAGAGVWFLRTPTSQAPGVVLSRLTEDSGVSFSPAISPDGRLLAFASDRSGAGNLDIWVTQIAGGEPVRVTHDEADDTTPTFSSDSSRIAFDSTRDGGGIYVVSALGGESKLVAAGGKGPKYSPNGKWLAYYQGEVDAAGGVNRGVLYIMPSSGGPARELQTDLLGVRDPVWSPDSTQLLVLGSDPKSGTADWYLLPVNAGPPVALHIPERSARSYIPRAWLGDFIYFEDGRDVWRIRILGSQLRWEAQRITAGTSTHSGLSAGITSAGVPLLAFSSDETNVDIWQIPADLARGKVTGEPQRLTKSLASERGSVVSGDRRKVVFLRGSRAWVKDLDTGREIEGPESEYIPTLNYDGSLVAYDAGGKVWLATPQQQSPSALGDKLSHVTDFTRDGKYALIVPRGGSTDPETRKVFLIDLETRQQSLLTQHASWFISGGRLSPDEHWFVTHAISSTTARQMFAAPFRTSVPVSSDEWIMLTDGRHLDRSPQWAPDGKLIYFLSTRDGFQCVWAVSFDAATRKPGTPFPVYHAHAPGLTMDFIADTSMVGLSVTNKGLIVSMQELKANVWLARLQ